MKVNERDLQIRYIHNEINSGEIDLRPDFQRGEVWSSQRKKMLVDSIMRKWHVPPIHLVKIDNSLSEVLDGQQRLTAIRDFKEDKFRVDGQIEPYDEDIARLSGLKYSQLSKEDKDKFDKYDLKIYEIVDYNQGEPGELFHRLNQSVKLTSAEQRNAFYGDIRNYVSALVSHMNTIGLDKTILGFGNSRMAYNDLITRVSYYVESGTIREQVTDRTLTNRYRESKTFSSNVEHSVKRSLEFLVDIKNSNPAIELSLTKASSLSWLTFLSFEIYSNPDIELPDKLAKSFSILESARFSVKNNLPFTSDYPNILGVDERSFREMILMYIERSSSRVTSLGSILIRDIIICTICYLSGYQMSLSNQDFKKLNSLCEHLKEDKLDTKQEIENLSEVWKIGERSES